MLPGYILFCVGLGSSGIRLSKLGRSTTFLQLCYHAINVECRVAVLGLECLLSSLGNHPTLDPHLGSFCHGEVAALRDVERSNLGVAGAQTLIEEWLEAVSLMSYADADLPSGKLTSHPIGLFRVLLSSSNSRQSLLTTKARRRTHQ